MPACDQAVADFTDDVEPLSVAEAKPAEAIASASSELSERLQQVRMDAAAHRPGCCVASAVAAEKCSVMLSDFGFFWSMGHHVRQHLHAPQQ